MRAGVAYYTDAVHGLAWAKQRGVCVLTLGANGQHIPGGAEGKLRRGGQHSCVSGI